MGLRDDVPLAEFLPGGSITDENIGFGSLCPLPPTEGMSPDLMVAGVVIFSRRSRAISAATAQPRRRRASAAAPSRRRAARTPASCAIGICSTSRSDAASAGTADECSTRLDKLLSELEDLLREGTHAAEAWREIPTPLYTCERWSAEPSSPTSICAGTRSAGVADVAQVEQHALRGWTPRDRPPRYDRPGTGPKELKGPQTYRKLRRATKRRTDKPKG